jgi:hypothetical protein
MTVLTILTYKDGNIMEEEINYFSKTGSVGITTGIYYTIKENVITRYYSNNEKNEITSFLITSNEKYCNKEYIYASSISGGEMKIINFLNRYGIIIYSDGELLRIEEILYAKN